MLFSYRIELFSVPSIPVASGIDEHGLQTEQPLPIKTDLADIIQDIIDGKVPASQYNINDELIQDIQRHAFPGRNGRINGKRSRADFL